ncbi:hypothetical protein CF327_g1161 [Tilletia walkeri]|uniref:Cytochrome b5 heme-binding domain-containing protein n=1 Tax=Tilletia walkeri TaxID=117179 RepID=A0A8X7NF27_9BASI|nr:hypothetical protein CF327_g1161 [Tilletia walkeri]KAE8271883.1 hypothetical protein A4X09_0g437 [Tilletia walkeri]
MTTVTLQIARLVKFGLLLATFILALSSAASATAPSSDGADAAQSGGAGGKRKPSRQLRVISVEQLRSFDGSNASLPLLIALDRRVYDVSSKRDVYGPGGGYETFSGRDSTRNFALYSTETKDDGSCIDDLGEKEVKMLAEWRKWFDDHYPLVGQYPVQDTYFEGGLYQAELPPSPSAAVITEKLCEDDDAPENAARRGFAIPSSQKSTSQQQHIAAQEEPASSQPSASAGSRSRPSPSTEL